MKVTTSSLLCLTTLILGHIVHAKKFTDPKNPPKNAVLLSTINSLTLRAGKQTSARRSSAVPQLTCSGPSHVCKLYSVDVMRCTNEGSDYDTENVQWSCKASLPPEFKLGATEVGCEGYESSEDPYVLKGSCGVEYRLLLTEQGQRNYGVKNEKSRLDEFGGGKDVSSQLFSFIFVLLFVGIIFVILRSIYTSLNDPNRPMGAPGVGWGGSGGGGGGPDDPPPPYDDYSAPPRKPTTRSPRSSSSRSSGGSQAANEQWRPGFWTGTAAGAAGGYAAGRYANRTRAPPPETRQTGGGLFGGGPSSSSGSSGPSYSSSRNESTGFGGTSRR